MPVEDLWGALPQPDPSVKPVAILREQASILSTKTNNLLEGMVKHFETGQAQIVGYAFYIKCPTLDNYEFHVLTFTHHLLHIFPFNINDAVNGRGFKVASDEEFRLALKDIFGSEALRRVISALLREANSVSESPR